MSEERLAIDPPWAKLSTCAVLFAVDPRGTGGVALRGAHGSVRERWLDDLRALLPASAVMRRVPLGIGDARLLGAIDLAATLGAGRPIAERGLLAESDGGVLVLAMAERLTAASAARITAAIDTGDAALERDGLSRRQPARFGVVALDEGLSDDEAPPPALLDRLAFHVDLAEISQRDLPMQEAASADRVVAARDRLARVRCADAMLEALCHAARELGVNSVRAPMFALRVARAAAAYDGRDDVDEDDVVLAASLVLAPRATMLPVEPEAAQEPPPAPEEQRANERPSSPDTGQPLDDMVLAAAAASIPSGLLERLGAGQLRRGSARESGRAGAPKAAALRGRPVGTRRGEPRSGGRLDAVETLRAAAPWQPVRHRQRLAASSSNSGGRRLEVRPEDFRLKRFKQRSRSTSIFIVDASGSQALHRLAEAKGAVELLLADCYVRRDQVAMIAFRGKAAELVLPPTRSLVRAKRSLAGLPGGGGTPLAAGLELAETLAEALERKGDSTLLVLLSDGCGNVGRDGQPGRAQSEADVRAIARRMRAGRRRMLVIDTSPRAQAVAARLAEDLGARYLPLPRADSRALSAAARVAGPARA